jgi:hypothetical protein
MFDLFELRRQSDDLVYRFKRSFDGFERQDDPNLKITYRGSDWGWGAFDNQGVYGLTGRPWDVLPKDQSPDHPPPGIWVSRKNEKSYVYDLIYVDNL